MGALRVSGIVFVDSPCVFTVFSMLPFEFYANTDSLVVKLVPINQMLRWEHTSAVQYVLSNLQYPYSPFTLFRNFVKKNAQNDVTQTQKKVFAWMSLATTLTFLGNSTFGHLAGTCQAE